MKKRSKSSPPDASRQPQNKGPIPSLRPRLVVYSGFEEIGVFADNTLKGILLRRNGKPVGMTKVVFLYVSKYPRAGDPSPWSLNGRGLWEEIDDRDVVWTWEEVTTGKDGRFQVNLPPGTLVRFRTDAKRVGELYIHPFAKGDAPVEFYLD